MGITIIGGTTSSAAGSSAITYRFTTAAAATQPPTGQFSPFQYSTAMTGFYVSITDANSLPVSSFLGVLPVGSLITLRTADNTKLRYLQVLTAPILLAGNAVYQIPVLQLGSGVGTLAAGDVIYMDFDASAAGGDYIQRIPAGYTLTNVATDQQAFGPFVRSAGKFRATIKVSGTTGSGTSVRFGGSFAPSGSGVVVTSNFAPTLFGTWWTGNPTSSINTVTSPNANWLAGSVTAPWATIPPSVSFFIDMVCDFEISGYGSFYLNWSQVTATATATTLTAGCSVSVTAING